MKIRICLALFFVCFTLQLMGQNVTFSNIGIKTIYVGIVNEINIGLSHGKKIEFPLEISVSRGELKIVGDKYYYFTFSSGDVCFKILNLTDMRAIDSVVVKAKDIDDYEFSIYPKIGHFWNLDHFEIDSIIVSSSYLDMTSSVCYDVSKFKIDIQRKDKTLATFEIDGYFVDRKISDSIKSIVKCDDKLIFHSFEINTAGYKSKSKRKILELLQCNNRKD